VFFHGYGRYPQLFGDPRLCFKRRQVQADAATAKYSVISAKKQAEEASAAEAGGAGATNGAGLAQGSSDSSGSSSSGSGSGVQSSSQAAPQPQAPEEGALSAALRQAGMMGGVGAASGDTVGAGQTHEPTEEEKVVAEFEQCRMPEIQMMNKLLIWLVTEEEREERKEKEKGKKRRQAHEVQHTSYSPCIILAMHHTHRTSYSPFIP
jgi:hypothetical protein